jgi:hypothetical protein
MSKHFVGHYAVLGLRPDAGWHELRAAYRKKVRAWHPDRQHDPALHTHAEEQTKAINRAYEELAEFYRHHATLPLSAPSLVDLDTSETTKPAAPTTASGPHTAGHKETDTPKRQFPNILRAAIALGLAIAAWLFLRTSALVDQPPPLNTTQLPSTRFAGETAVPSPALVAAEPSFTYGSTMSEVLNVHGTPSHMDRDVWHYRGSKIYFRNGTVIRWEEGPEHRLRARVAPDATSKKQTFGFSKGSTKTEVLIVQGAPIRETDKMWDYGVSRIYFEGDQVIDWYESPLDPLKVKR